MIAAAGRQRVPFTSGILIGIGETRLERIELRVARKALHDQHDHLQEIIVQNFRAKPGTRFAGCEEPDLDDLLWTAAAARLMFGAQMNIQGPPNLSYEAFPRLLEAGINHWGGISPPTADHVNPEAPWPDLVKLRSATEQAGMTLQQRLAIYPGYVAKAAAWPDRSLATAVLRAVGADGFAREDDWTPGSREPLPVATPRQTRTDRDLDALLRTAMAGERLSEAGGTSLFKAPGGAVHTIFPPPDPFR